MRTNRFDYPLPPSFIAQEPAEPRDNSRLMVLHRFDGHIDHRRFRDLGEYLKPGDVLVANDTRVIRARLRAQKITGGLIEVFLLHSVDKFGFEWECLVGGKGLGEGSQFQIVGPGHRSTHDGVDSVTKHFGTVKQVLKSGERIIRFSEAVSGWLEELGEIPLPPYIHQ